MHVIFYKIAKCYHTRCYPDTANAHCRTILTLLLQLHACSIVSMVIKKLVSLLLCHTHINIHLPSQPGYDAQDLISLSWHSTSRMRGKRDSFFHPTKLGTMPENHNQPVCY